MRVGRTALVMAGLSVSSTLGLSAQASLRVSAGARYSTSLVRDSLVVPVTLRPAIAPAVALGVRDGMKGPWSFDGALEFSRATLDRRESGSSTGIGSVSIIALTLGLRREVATDFAGKLAVGGLVYRGGGTGVFSNGNGGVFPLVSLGASYAPKIGSSRGLELGLQYDLHRFITPALRTVGFNKARPVHRLALTVSARVLGR